LLVPVGKALAAALSAQIHDLGCQIQVVHADAVPFEQGEFGVVERACLSGTEYPADFVDVPEPGGQQSFHRIFR
jgi:hypothetical protein